MLRLLSNSKMLHKSSVSNVYLTPHNTIIKEVCKQLNYKNEKYCLETIIDPKIVPKTYSIIDQDLFIYYEMEYMEGGDLLNYIHDREDNDETIDNEEWLSYIFQIISALTII